LCPGLLILGCDFFAPVGSEIPNHPPIAYPVIGDASEWPLHQVREVPVRRPVLLDSIHSQDDEGSLVDFSWSFRSVPAGSVLTDRDLVSQTEDFLDSGTLRSVATFTPDIVGNFVVELIVVDDDGAQSEPGSAVAIATARDLELTLSWETPGVDLDLHLVRPGGTYWGTDGAESDCFSLAPNPDWGSPASSGDNPRLAGDADGSDPLVSPYLERISLELPAPGVYHVYVHDYDHHLGSGVDPVLNIPEVSMFASSEGEPRSVLRAPVPIGAGDVWSVGEIHWPEVVLVPDGTVWKHDELGGPPYHD
jgi:hypothetical protein